MHTRTRSALVLTALLATFTGAAPAGPSSALTGAEDELHVDPEKGKPNGKGTKSRPFASLSEALASLPEPLSESVTIRLAAGIYETTGGVGMPERTLELMHRMRPGVSVTLAGPAGAAEGERPVLAWLGDRRTVEVTEGTWEFERLQIGSFDERQRRGVHVVGPAHAILRDVEFRLRSGSDAGIWAERGGRVTLRGAIGLNRHLTDEAPPESFCGVLAEHHGVVGFDERSGSSLVLGNGNLSVRTYGVIRLGCETAEISCWTKSNNLTVNNGGRIDVANTTTTLRAHMANNTPIGLEHDGHLLAEDAHIRIVGPNDSAIALQKSSTLTCNDIELVGEFEFALWASSGSMFVGRFLTDVPKLRARTGAQLHVERLAGKLTAEPEVGSGGLISLPDRVLRSE